MLRLRRLLLVAVLLMAAACGDDDGGGGGEGAAGEDGCPDLPESSEETTETTAADDSEAAPSEGGGDSSSQELFEMTVGILPVADLAPLYYGIEQGYFEEEGLDVGTEVGQGGAALLPSVLSGEYDIAFGNYVSVMLAREQNADVQIMSNLVSGADTADRGTNALLVGPDSGIESVDDLAGQTFAVSTLENVAEVNIRTTLCRAGVDVSGIQFTELPFPDMNAAVEAGEVDVAWQAEPFVTLGEQSGLVNVADPMYETTPSMPLAGMFASGAWLEEHEEHAAAFYRALQRSIEASSDEQAMRDAIAANTETPPPVVAELALANWQPELDTEKLAFVGELAAEYGILEEEPNMDELVWIPPDE